MPDYLEPSSVTPFYVAAALLGYLLGSIPFGLIVTKLAGAPDPRRIGSGNIGATNVLRTGRKDLAALTLILDAAKGTAAVLGGARFGPDLMVIAAAGAFLGHLFPVWLGLHGGKGVATFLGILIGLDWRFGLAAILVWLAAASVWRYSSLAALVTAALAPLYVLFFLDQGFMGLVLALSIAIFVRHRSNIIRLLQGTEPKIGQS
jgi:glycerol-3-phosphate acyltransferase PlsY